MVLFPDRKKLRSHTRANTSSSRHCVKKSYIPELSEVRMIQRAPRRPFVLSAEDARYIERCLRDVEAAFAIDGFARTPFSQIPARALIKQLIDWWRSLEPADEAQREAHGRLPSAIRLLDTVSTWMEERARRR